MKTFKICIAILLAMSLSGCMPRVDMADHYAKLSGDLAADVMSRLG